MNISDEYKKLTEEALLNMKPKKQKIIKEPKKQKTVKVPKTKKSNVKIDLEKTTLNIN